MLHIQDGYQKETLLHATHCISQSERKKGKILSSFQITSNHKLYIAHDFTRKINITI